MSALPARTSTARVPPPTSSGSVTVHSVPRAFRPWVSVRQSGLIGFTPRSQHTMGHCPTTSLRPPYPSRIPPPNSPCCSAFFLVFWSEFKQAIVLSQKARTNLPDPRDYGMARKDAFLKFAAEFNLKPSDIKVLALESVCGLTIAIWSFEDKSACFFLLLSVL